MISLIYNDREINFSNNILKISEFINTLYEDSEHKPIEITNEYVTDDVLHYFNLWFNELDKIEIVKYEIENVIFKPTIFKECNIKTLIDIFDFGLYFQIKLLCETISYILSKYVIKECDDKYYIEDYRIQITLVKMMLKYMSKYHFKNQSLNIQSLIEWDEICVLEYFPNIEEYDIIFPYGKTEICDYEFKGRRKFKKVFIPSSVTSIGESAFCECESLEEIIIPNSVTNIGDSAFYKCTSLKEVVIPDSVTNIGRYAFGHCMNLTKVVIPEMQRLNVTSIDEFTFEKCTSLTEIVIPNSVKSIGKSAFENCESLKEVVIPNSVTSIDDYAFYNCGSLTKVVIPSSVKSIGDCAFDSSFTEVITQ